MSHIFISYSHKDQTYAHKLHQHLFEHDFDVWIDDRLDYGSRWPLEIEKRIKECSVFILIMSPNSYKSEWVLNELAFARQLEKQIYTLLLEGDPWWHLGTIQYVDVRNAELPPGRFFVSLAKIAPQEKNKSNISIHLNGNIEGNILVGNDNSVSSSAFKLDETIADPNATMFSSGLQTIPPRSIPRPPSPGQPPQYKPLTVVARNASQPRAAQPQPVTYDEQSPAGRSSVYKAPVSTKKQKNSMMTMVAAIVLFIFCIFAACSFLLFVPCWVVQPIVGGSCL